MGIIGMSFALFVIALQGMQQGSTVGKSLYNPEFNICLHLFRDFCLSKKSRKFLNSSLEFSVKIQMWRVRKDMRGVCMYCGGDSSVV